MSATSKSSQQRLDEVTRLNQVDAFDVPGYLDALALEVEAAVAEAANPAEAIDETLRGALTAIDSFAGRTMRIRLNHALADDASVPAQFRTYLATRILDYADDLDQLRARVHQVVGRVDPHGVTNTANTIVGAADRVLTVRAQLRQGVLAMIPAKPTDEKPAPEPPAASFFDNIELD